jgi:dethiobiotin synthetase
MSQYFVSGIGTDVGKTFCSCALLHAHPHLRAIKPVLSGFEDDKAEASDAGQLLSAMNQAVTPSHLNSISPYRFKAPLSPHLAAKKEGSAIDEKALLAFCKQQMTLHKNLLIEGVGGLMVPITDEWLVLDWMKALRLPTILVSASYLGAINHTLLSLQVLKSAKLPLKALIISQSEGCVGLQDTAESIRPFMPKGAALLTLPRQSSWKAASELLPLRL